MAVFDQFIVLYNSQCAQRDLGIRDYRHGYFVKKKLNSFTKEGQTGCGYLCIMCFACSYMQLVIVIMQQLDI